MASHTIELLDNSRNYVATIHNTPALDTAGIYLRYSDQLSDIGMCRFRVATKDPLFDAIGDPFQPFHNHVRIRRNGVVVWQGVVVNHIHRNKKYIEVEAKTYLFLFSKTLIRHDAADGAGAENFRTLKSDSLTTNITTLLNEIKADYSYLSSLAVGNMENPVFPAGFVDSAGTSIAGQPWSFSPTFEVKFDYRDFLYVLKALAAYSNCDFRLNKDFTLDFSTFIGVKQPNLSFTYGQFGNLEDYDLPLSGDNQANFITGIAADNNFNILKDDEQDTTSVNTYGKLAAVAAFADAKNIDVLRQRLRDELHLVATPDAEMHLMPNEKAFPLGQYGVGDIVTVNISDHVISVNEPRRVVFFENDVHLTGKEEIRIITNRPKDNQ